MSAQSEVGDQPDRAGFADRQDDPRSGFADRQDDPGSGFADRPNSPRSGFADRPGNSASGFADRYKRGEVLGRGTDSVVYRARDRLLGRDVALKVFRIAADDPEALTTQQDEARLLASLTHHGLVTLLDAGVNVDDDGLPHLQLVTDLVVGATLRDRIGATPLTERQVAYLGFDLAEALEYVHAHGVTHSDVTPTNVLVLAQGGSDDRLRARLTDFGVAQLVGRVRTVVSSTAGGAYRSPEQIRGEPIGPASDVYSLGLVLLEALTGRRAFTTGDDHRPSAGPEIPESTGPALHRALLRMTAEDPRERPSSRDLVPAFQSLVVDEYGRHRGRPSREEPSPHDEQARLAALHRYDLLDTPPEGAFDRITSLAARVLGTAISTVSIVDRERIWFKSHHGIDGTEIARDPGLCAAVVATGERIVVPDALAHPDAARNGLIAGDTGLRSYAGVPLVSADGHVLGALSVADYTPRQFTDRQLDILADLGAMVTHEMEMRLATRRAVLRHD